MLHLLWADLLLCLLDPAGMSLVARKTRKVLIRTWWSSLALARTSASAMLFVATRLLIVSSPRSAALVLSRRSAGNWNWKREVSGNERATTSIWDCFFFQYLKTIYQYPLLRSSFLCRGFMVRVSFTVFLLQVSLVADGIKRKMTGSISILKT